MRWFAPAALLALGGCTVIPKPASAPPTVQTPAPPPSIAPAAPAPVDWRDIPETPGGWTYRGDEAGSTAAFGPANGPAQFSLHCDRASRSITLSRPGTTPGLMTIRTSYEERSWPAAAAEGQIAVRLAAADPFLDKIAFTRGRFSVADPAGTQLVLPAWAEPARVIEDCRS